MHVGINVPNNFGVAAMGDLVDFAVAAEQLGCQSSWVSDHLFHAAYVAARLGDRPYHEPMTALTAIAARSSAMELGTSVLVLPWHHPVRLAKIVASLDEFSGGRVIVGVGVGSTEDEYAALGVPFGQRGKICNEYLEAMRALWTDDLPRFHGEFLSFEGLRFEPKPARKPHPPLWVGGNSPAALRRLVRHGDGWHPLGLSPNGLAAGRAELGEQLSAAGRDPNVPIAVRLLLGFSDESSNRPVSERKTCKGTADDMAAVIDAFAAVGVTHVILDGATRDLTKALADLERFAREVMPRLSHLGC